MNVGSISGFEGQRGQIDYAASKGAVMAMTMPMARELIRYNVRVVGIAPGLFKTDMYHKMGERVRNKIEQSSVLGRFGNPREFALFIKSIIENGYLTGVNLRLDGGTLLPKL